MKDPTIVEKPCGLKIQHIDYPDLRCNEPYVNRFTGRWQNGRPCQRCHPLGEQLASAAYCWHEFSNQEYACLAWNLTIAALLCLAETRAP